jgi:hypothetical protein
VRVARSLRVARGAVYNPAVQQCALQLCVCALQRRALNLTKSSCRVTKYSATLGECCSVSCTAGQPLCVRWCVRVRVCVCVQLHTLA